MQQYIPTICKNCVLHAVVDPISRWGTYKSFFWCVCVFVLNLKDVVVTVLGTGDA